ncbi:iron-siderophore ABC transporter substrate-binding protein [Nodularia sp. UHCC 0506]|uniref:iron-siderophore ABC transporter substrate-binding protein n=1 Tax=Nodularia sp. UHCC 0506 TaxID=3110243 RepID=UPI002B200147|nr:iron-siderophore ABC transporter substrate-binding protein [Nodularia sp. UHCC 0506]MEA5515997.1 iron-siderophore ABC transporter substrate-binding protein [Nodularia sp. UHCC 0506]
MCSLILVVACNSSTPQINTNQINTNQTPTSKPSDCRVINHDGGETEICGEPQKIAALGPPMLDILLSLGVQAAGYSEVRLINKKVFDNPSEQIPYLGDLVTNQPVNLGARNNPSIEAFVQLQPDLIIGEDGNIKKKYKLFSSIAPTAFFVNEGKLDWKTTIKAIAPALNREEKAQQVLASYNQLVEKAKKQLAPLISGKTIIVLGWSRTLNRSFIFPETFITRLLEDLGFKTIVGEANRSSISIEAIANLKTDYILVMKEENNTIDDAKQQWEENSIMSLIPAVQAGNIHFMDFQLVRIRGPIATEIIINQILQMLQT